MPEDELLHTIKDLVQAQLVIEESADLFSFRHALTREAVYATLLVRERRKLHRAIAETLERLHADSLEPHIADLAYHYYQAEAWDKACEYSQRAAEQAHAFFAPRETVEHATRALEATRHLNQASPVLLYRLRGQAYEILGDFARARADQEEALHAAREKKDRRAEWQALIDLGQMWAGRDYARTGEYFQEALQVARTEGDATLLAYSLNRFGNWLANTGNAHQGLPMHREALDIFRSQANRAGAATTIDLIAMTRLMTSDLIGSREDYQRAIALFRELNDKMGLASSLVPFSHVSHYADTVPSPMADAGEDDRSAQEALELAKQLGWASGQAFAHWGMAARLLGTGDYESAIQHARESLRLATEIGHRQWIIGANFQLGRTFIYLLQTEPAIEHLKQALSLARELGSVWWTGNVASHLATAHLLQGDLDRAEAILQEILPHERLLQAALRDLAERWIALAWARLEFARNRPREALQIAQTLVDSIPTTVTPQRIPRLLQVQGDALAAMGQLEQAEQHLGEALAGAEERHDLHASWEIHRSLGNLYRRRRLADRAEKEFGAAREIIHTLAERIKDNALRERFTHAALDTLPKEKIPSARRIEARQYGGLTERERQVAALIAQGKSNHAVAEALVVSERTIETHVGNILNKLGLRSRAQIAAWAVEKKLSTAPPAVRR